MKRWLRAGCRHIVLVVYRFTYRSDLPVICMPLYLRVKGVLTCMVYCCCTRIKREGPHHKGALRMFVRRCTA